MIFSYLESLVCRSLTYASIFLKNWSVIKIQDGGHLDRYYVCIETSGSVAKCQLLFQARRQRRSMDSEHMNSHFKSYYIIAPVPIVPLCQSSQLRKVGPFPVRSQKKMFTFHCSFKVSSFGPVEKMDLHKHTCGKITCVLRAWYQGQKENFNPLSKNKHHLRSFLLLLFVLSA